MSALQPNLTTYIRNISGKNIRTFAAAAKAKEASANPSGTPNYLPREELKTSSVKGVNVATVENNKPISKLAVYFKAGSRFEDDSNQGAVHALRIAAGLGTQGATRFGIARNIELVGGNFYCTAGREHIGYAIEATRDKIENIQGVFQDAVAKQAFKPWELEDALPRLKNDLQTLSPEVNALELLHRAAFRRGLGNSLYSPKHMVGKHTSSMLTDYVKKNFSDVTVVGLGVPHEVAAKFAKRLAGVKTDEDFIEQASSKFNAGGEIRKESGGDLAYVCLAREGVGLSDRKTALVAAVLHRALGAGSRLKYGNNSGAKLAAASSNEGVVTGLNISYSDAGLLGAIIVGTPSVVRQSTKKAAEILRGASFKEDEVARARNILKADLSTALDIESELLEDIALQTLLSGSVVSYNELVPLIDSVTVEDVNNLIKKGGGKLSMSAVGNIAKVPYLDEL